MTSTSDISKKRKTDQGMNSEFNVPRKILLLLRKHEKNLVISPDAFQHLNLLTFYKKRKALGDVCMAPASSVTGFKGLLFCVFLC